MQSVKAGFDPLSMMSKPKKKKVEKKPETKPVEDSSKKEEPKKENDTSRKSTSFVDGFDINYIRKFYTDKEFITKNCNLLPCEKIENYEKSSFKGEDIFSLGVLVLTKFRIIFRFQDMSQANRYLINIEDLEIPLFNIRTIKKSDKIINDKYCIDLTLKDTRIYKFYIWNKESFEFFVDLNEHVFPNDSTKLLKFTFDYFDYAKNQPNYTNGWQIYDIQKEYERQGITENNNHGLRLSRVNTNYDLCPSYPNLLVVPEKATDKEIARSAYYRTKSRFPAFTYLYKKDGNNASLWRSSQIKSGITGISDDGNKNLMEKIIKLTGKLYIFDARPFVNAFTNKIVGSGGYENAENYTNAIVEFCDIENIHECREAYDKIFSLSQSGSIMINQKLYSDLDDTKWYEFIYKILKFSLKIAEKILNNINVMVHCTDGWDRTCQLVSTAELILEPYYRTFKGFAVLIEKDWLSFGHQFGLRQGMNLSGEKYNEEQRSPIFIQWLDVVHQLLYQFPNAFEFNQDLLIYLGKVCGTNMFGTFLFNSDKERVKYEAKNKTVSVWTDVKNNFSRYVNYFYNPENITQIIKPNIAPYSLDFWDEFFMQHAGYVENRITYLDENKTQSFQAAHQFYDNDKIQDEKKFKELYEKISLLKEGLVDVYNVFNSNNCGDVLEKCDGYSQRLIKQLSDQDEKTKQKNIEKYLNLFGTTKASNQKETNVAENSNNIENN